jgi:hypothetical protein
MTADVVGAERARAARLRAFHVLVELNVVALPCVPQNLVLVQVR